MTPQEGGQSPISSMDKKFPEKFLGNFGIIPHLQVIRIFIRKEIIMKRTVRLTEKDFARMVRRVVKESEFEMDLDMEEMDNVKGDINKVMDFAYEMITDYAPEGPRNKANYRRAIDQLEKDFNYALRNLRGNIGM